VRKLPVCGCGGISHYIPQTRPVDFTYNKEHAQTINAAKKAYSPSTALINVLVCLW